MKLNRWLSIRQKTKDIFSPIISSLWKGHNNRSRAKQLIIQWPNQIHDLKLYIVQQALFDAFQFSLKSCTLCCFALQALKAAEISPMKWNCEDAVGNLLKSQNKETGAFADSLGATLAIMPTMAHSSLADLKYIKPECDIPHKGKILRYQ